MSFRQQKPSTGRSPRFPVVVYMLGISNGFRPLHATKNEEGFPALTTRPTVSAASI